MIEKVVAVILGLVGWGLLNIAATVLENIIHLFTKIGV